MDFKTTEMWVRHGQLLFQLLLDRVLQNRKKKSALGLLLEYLGEVKQTKT